MDLRKEEIHTFLQRRLKKLHARLLHHQEDEKSGAEWERAAHCAEMLKSQFPQLKRGMRSIAVEDWLQPGEAVLLPLDPALGPEEQLAVQFKLSRKLKRRYAAAQQLIASTQVEIAALETALRALSSIEEEEDLAAFEKKVGFRKQMPPSKGAPKEKRHPFREFTTLAGRTIFVGKKDQDNDLLTFTVAHGGDLWFHAGNTPGSHVVLRVPKTEAVDEDSIQDALQLALHFSKARGRGKEEVVMTECKYLQKPRGAPPGQVTLSRHKTLLVREEEKRLKRLLGKLC